MTNREDVRTTLYDAEHALPNGDAARQHALRSRHERVSVLGAWRSAHGPAKPDELSTSP